MRRLPDSIRLDYLPGYIFLILLIGLWEAASLAQLVDTRYLPGPGRIGKAIVETIDRGRFLSPVTQTIAAMIPGLALGTFLGICGGVIMGRMPAVRTAFTIPIEMLRPLPSIVLIPLALLVIGDGWPMEVLLIALPTMWIVWFATLKGVLGISKTLIDNAKLFHIGPLQRTMFLVIPAASPMMISGIIIATGLSLIVAVTVEIVTGNRGLGAAIIKSQTAFQIPTMYAYVILSAILGYVMNWLVKSGGRRLLRWKQFDNRLGTR